jgi:type III secretion system YscD/HrpQ family protein
MSEQRAPAPQDATRTLELRVHSGVHAGACERLTQASYTIGSDAACDVVLSDANMESHHACLVQAGSTWLLQLDAAETPVELGTLYPLGPLWMSVNLRGAPWPAVDEARPPTLPAPPSSPSPAEASGPMAELAASALEPFEPNNTADPLEETGTKPAPQARRSKAATAALSFALMGALMAVTVSVVAWTLWPDAQRSLDAATTAQPSSEGRPVNAGQHIDAVRQVITSLGMSGQVTADVGPGGLPLVKATLISDDNYETLAMALSNLNPRPALEVTTEQDLSSQLKVLLSEQADELDTALESHHVGAGKFKIVGKLASPEQRLALLSHLKTALPAAVTLESALSVPEERAQGMLKELLGSGLAQIRGRWLAGRLDMAIELDAPDVPRWEQLLVLAARKSDVPFTARVSIRPNRVLPTVLAQLPFRLQSVVGGDTPYVVLGGGEKLLLQGQSQGWRLVSIDPGSVVFEGQQARKVVVQR